MADKMYVRHQPDGELYAIYVKGDEVLGCAGPLHYSEVGQEHEYNDEDIEWARTELGLGHFAMLGHEQLEQMRL